MLTRVGRLREITEIDAMPSHGRNSNGKKHRHQKNKPDEPMLVPRLDADPYPPHVPRPSQADSFSSRASTSTARGRMPYDPSPSLGGPAESWRTNHDHSYDYPIPPPPPEIYSHGHGSGLDMYNPRDADWRHGASEPYRDEYYDRGYPVSYPPEPPSWGMAPAYDRPAAYWPPADDRVPSSSHRTTERRPEPETLPNWRHDRRREKDPQTWQPDNGWEPRPRPSKGKAWEQPSPWETPAMREDRAAAAAAAKEEEDRMWQPAPGWNASGKGESSHHGRSQTNQRNLPPIGEDKVPSKSSKKASKSKAHRRQDEEDLNKYVSQTLNFLLTDSYPRIIAAGQNGMLRSTHLQKNNLTRNIGGRRIRALDLQSRHIIRHIHRGDAADHAQHPLPINVDVAIKTIVLEGSIARLLWTVGIGGEN